MTLVHQDLAKALATQGISLQDALDALVRPEPPDPATPSPTPKTVALSDTARKALRTVPKALADTTLPGKPKVLTEIEKREWIPLFDQIKEARSALEAAEAAFKEVFHNHLDLTYLHGEHADDTVVEYDSHGHVVVKGEVRVDGLPKKVVRDERGGKANLPTLPDLQRLEADGVIDHKAFLRMTSVVPATRKPDIEAIMREIAATPGLLEKLAEIVSVVPKSTAMRVAKND